jgi:hypothetical protein
VAPVGQFNLDDDGALGAGFEFLAGGFAVAPDVDVQTVGRVHAPSVDERGEVLRDRLGVRTCGGDALAALAAQVQRHRRSPPQIPPPGAVGGDDDAPVSDPVADRRGVLLAALSPGETEQHERVTDQPVQR